MDFLPGHIPASSGLRPLCGRQQKPKWRYWEIDPHLSITYKAEQQYIEHFLEIFKKAVRCRLCSIYTVGILLSGGLDSGSIASTVGWLAQKSDLDPKFELHAYCLAFLEQPEYDERHISQSITTHYGFPVTDVPADDARPLSNYLIHGPDSSACMYNFAKQKKISYITHNICLSPSSTNPSVPSDEPGKNQPQYPSPKYTGTVRNLKSAECTSNQFHAIR